jgi:lipoprotein-anchoring transpeptidase ErfK/SrfK
MGEKRTLLSLLTAGALAMAAAGCVPAGTAPLAPAANGNAANTNGTTNANANANTANANTNTSAQTGAAVPRVDERVSARSDSVTGGRIERTELARNNPDLRITMNAPAYQLTLWQGGKEVKTWPIAIGLKKYPLPSGSRTAERMVLNPDWIPPDSTWVEEHEDVKPGERVPAGDKRNPLGEIKIPLGDDGTLIHEAKSRAELGRPVSHGCARMVRADLVELTEMIAAAQGLPLTGDEIRATIKTDEQREIALQRPIPIDISYDTAVVEGGKLYLFADVYEENTNAVAGIREELAAAGVDATALDEKALQTAVARPKGSAAYVVPVDELKAGRGLAAGKIVSLDGRDSAPSGKNDKNAKGGRGAQGRR